MALPPREGPLVRESWYRRGWARANRPFVGCGCLTLVLVALVLWWLFTVIF